MGVTHFNPYGFLYKVILSYGDIIRVDRAIEDFIHPAYLFVLAACSLGSVFKSVWQVNRHWAEDYTRNGRSIETEIN